MAVVSEVVIEIWENELIRKTEMTHDSELDLDYILFPLPPKKNLK